MDALVIMVVTASWGVVGYPLAINVSPIAMPNMEVCEKAIPEIKAMVREEVGKIGKGYVKYDFPDGPLQTGFRVMAFCKQLQPSGL